MLKRTFSIFLIILILLTSLPVISIARALEEYIKSEIQVSQVDRSITTIDVTGLVTGAYAKHSHVYEEKYDANNHWQECIICNDKINIKAHSLSRNYASTILAKCASGNHYTDVCNGCGYCSTGHIPCTWDGHSWGYYTSYVDWKRCSVCKDIIVYSYYHNGTLHTYSNSASDRYIQDCKKADGSRITCQNLGTCATCGTNYNEVRHAIVLRDNRVYCTICNANFGTYTVSRKEETTSSNVVKCTSVLDLSLTNGATLLTTDSAWENTVFRNETGVWDTLGHTLNSINSSNTSAKITYVGTFLPSYKAKYGNYEGLYISVNGVYHYAGTRRP